MLHHEESSEKPQYNMATPPIFLDLPPILPNSPFLAKALVTATTSVHLPKPVSTDLTIKPDSVLTNPVGKDGVRSWSM